MVRINRNKIKKIIKKALLKEGGFPRVRMMMTGLVPSVQTIGIMTAENPGAQPQDPKQNKQLNKTLMQKFRDMNYGPIPIGGSFGQKENSFLIPNITREDLTTLGRQFGQEAVIWASREGEGMRWEYIEGDNTVETRDVSLGGSDVQSKEDYYSEKKGRKFIIPFFDPEYEKATQTGSGRGIDKQMPPTEDDLPPSARAVALHESIKKRSKLCIDNSRTPRSRWHHRGVYQVELKELQRIIQESKGK